MASVYTKAGNNYITHDKNIFGLFTSGRNFVIDGIRFISKGSPEFDEWVNVQEEMCKRCGYSGDRLKSLVASLYDMDSAVATTAFQGMKYKDTMRNTSFVCDREIDMFAQIWIPERRIALHSYYNPQTGEKHDDVSFLNWSDALPYGNLFYDGSIKDALSEFVENGFAIDIVRTPTGIEEMRKTLGQRGVKSFIVEEENVALERIFSATA